MTDPYRAMCAELVETWDATADFDFNDFGHAAADIVDRARALLAQPVAEGLTDEELLESAAKALGYKSIPRDETYLTAEAYAHAVLAGWGNPTPPPVAISERLPGPEDCDGDGWCWGWRSFNPEVDDLGEFWLRIPCEWLGNFSRWTHWLPANALFTPEATND